MNKYYNKNNVVKAIQFTLDNLSEIAEYIKFNYIRRIEVAFDIDGQTPFLSFPDSQIEKKVREYDWIVFGDELEVLNEEDFNSKYGKLK